MIRKLMILTGALAAAFAPGAAATTASAAEFHSEKQLTNITGASTTTHDFTTPAVKVTCQQASFLGTMIFTTQQSLTLSPSYSNCDMKITGGETITGATVKLNECDYLIHGSGRNEIQCPAGKAIEFSVSGCVLTIVPQTDATANTYANNGKHIDLTFGPEIFYKTSGLLCGATEGSKGSYAGAATLSGKQSGAPVKIWHT